MTRSVPMLGAVVRGAQWAVLDGLGTTGAACLAAGVLLTFGVGPALIALGILFLVGAWGSR